MKKIIYKISIYKVLPPYKNWYSITTDDGLNRSNIVIVGKKQLLKVALALIVMAIFNKRTTINSNRNRYETDSRRSGKAWVLRSNRNGITYKTQLITQYKLLIFSCVFAFYKQDVFHIRF